jgi:hypothetical protein
VTPAPGPCAPRRSPPRRSPPRRSRSRAPPRRRAGCPTSTSSARPTSPAFTILDIAPAQVERPTVPATFAAGFLRRVGEGGDVIPRSYAVEVAPYWWVPHPRLTFGEYERGGPASVVRTFTRLGGDDRLRGRRAGAPAEDAAFRRLAVGARAMLFAGRPGARARSCVASVNAAATSVARRIAAAVADSIVRNPRLASDTAWQRRVNQALWPVAVDALPPEEREVLQKRTTQCARELSARRGFVLDAAVASALAFPGGRAAGGRPSAWGRVAHPGLPRASASATWAWCACGPTGAAPTRPRRASRWAAARCTPSSASRRAPRRWCAPGRRRGRGARA